jgi:hypothetical protein
MEKVRDSVSTTGGENALREDFEKRGILARLKLVACFILIFFLSLFCSILIFSSDFLFLFSSSLLFFSFLLSPPYPYTFRI